MKSSCGEKHEARGKLGIHNSQTMTGVTCATFPTSSSACMMRFILATGNLVLTTTPAAKLGAWLPLPVPDSSSTDCHGSSSSFRFFGAAFLRARFAGGASRHLVFRNGWL